MDTNNWRPTAPGGEPVMDMGDWRAQLQTHGKEQSTKCKYSFPNMCKCCRDIIILYLNERKREGKKFELKSAIQP